jgi:hypothetical protein
MSIKSLKNKKAQEEMVGFILIIILVIVGILFILFIALRQPATERKSTEIKSFLYASVGYTTDCRRDVSGFYDLKGLIRACGNNQFCYGDNRDVCSVLNETFSYLIESSFVIDAKSPYKGYVLNIVEEDGTPILYIEQGVTQGNSKGNYIPLPGGISGGEIIINFNLFS